MLDNYILFVNPIKIISSFKKLQTKNSLFKFVYEER